MTQSVFRVDARTISRGGSAATDCRMPDPAALSWASVTESSGLRSTSGLDVKLVHGDEHEEIVGSVKTRIAKDHSTEVDRNAKHTVGGNRTEKVIGNASTSTIGSHTALHIGPANSTYLSAQTESRRDDLQREHHSSYFHSLETKVEKSEMKWEIPATSVTVAGTEWSLVTGKIELAALAASVCGSSKEATLEKSEMAALKEEVASLETKCGPQVRITQIFNIGLLTSFPPSMN